MRILKEKRHILISFTSKKNIIERIIPGLVSLYLLGIYASPPPPQFFVDRSTEYHWHSLWYITIVLTKTLKYRNLTAGFLTLCLIGGIHSSLWNSLSWLLFCLKCSNPLNTIILCLVRHVMKIMHNLNPSNDTEHVLHSPLIQLL